MNKQIFYRIIYVCLLFLFVSVSEAQNKTGKANNMVIVDPSLWCAIDGQGNKIDPETAIYPDIAERRNKYVGIFYFIWHGCHGYDKPANHNDVQIPTATDVESPYDLSKILAKNSVQPQWGPPHVMHHWGEPYLGYYVSNDEWVIRKHAQMLSDAGVDVVILDVTNAYTYVPVVKTILDIYTQMRREGSSTPQFAFILNSSPTNTFNTLYSEIYEKKLYEDLWFRWMDKPLILVDPDAVPATCKDMFTIRHSWYLWNNKGADTWFGDGVDKWPWAGLYPQQAGIHEGKNEFVSVAAATHPISNIGRSFDVKTNTEPVVFTSGKGEYFQSQFNWAMELDPTFLFFTGWNEWTAQRQIASRDNEVSMPDRPVQKGDTYFVDQYNHEFSRDIEPLNGDFGDNYYYLLADYIRKFKGVHKLPVTRNKDRIRIDGNMMDWVGVDAVYADDQGDTKHRNHFGWGRLGTLTNTTGRNDIILSKITTDGINLFFYVKTAEAITSYKDMNWMQLFFQVRGCDAPSWEGFEFVVNRTGVTAGKTFLEKCMGGWNWNKVKSISYCIKNNEMELAIPLRSLSIATDTGFSIDFKWIDNAVADGDIQTCMCDGDSAPNGRFRYRFSYSKK
ncbi:hypothetical protein [Bacteroides sp.]|uniref:hypothetical protein n=1 Tax=Bacteroides sp. TaxID=29523 RepID=UPI002613F304|nr:hypothetical protein [Bacteroides sp.]MDD3039339.1 hypothetical protein [Bacteroides sp.]